VSGRWEAGGGRREAGVDWDCDVKKQCFPFGVDNRYKIPLVFASEKQREEMVASLTKVISEETKVEIECWGLGGSRKLEVMLPLSSADPVVVGAFSEFGFH